MEHCAGPGTGAFDDHRRRPLTSPPLRECPPLPCPLCLLLLVYVVFGTSGGIGSALAELLAVQPGAQLLLSGRDESRLQAAASRAQAAGAASVGVAPADPLEVAAVEAVMNDAVQRYGRIDGVANCVGSVLLKSGTCRRRRNVPLSHRPVHPPISRLPHLQCAPCSPYHEPSRF